MKLMQELTPQRKRKMKRLRRKMAAFVDNQALYPGHKPFPIHFRAIDRRAPGEKHGLAF
jgi:hypothetical protein